MQTKLSEHPQDLLADYAMGLLEDDELYVVEKHLASCERCQQELDQLDSVMVAWTEALPQEKPSDLVWQGLQARIAADKASEGGTIAEENNARDTDVLPEIATRVEPEEVPLQQTPIPLSTQVLPWIMAASCFVFAIGGGFWGLSRNQAAVEARANQALLSSYLSQPSVQKVVLFNEADASIGSILLSEQEALFVLGDQAPNQKSYQAWGHTSDDWTADSGELLTSLGLSSGNLLEIQTAGFASLYLSLEPRGGSPQPTQPLTSVSLGVANSPATIEVLSPVDGAVLGSASSIVRGELSSAVRSLSYRLNGGDEVSTSFSNRRFAFTVTGLREGENSLEFLVTLADGTTASERLGLVYQP